MPLRVNSPKEMGGPDRMAMPSVTMLALDQTAVRLPPRSPPSASDHHNTWWWCGPVIVAARWLTIGVIVATYGTLSMKPETSVRITRIIMVGSKTLPPVKPAASPPNILMTPVLNKPPTMMKRPTMNSKVSHSTLDMYSDCSNREVKMRAPAPSSATRDGAMWIVGARMNPTNTTPMTPPHLTRSRRSRMTSLS